MVPVAVLIHPLVLADVVHRGEERQAPLVGESGGEALGNVTVLGAIGRVGVDVPRGQVFLLYLQVDDGGFVLVVLAEKLLVLIGLFVSRYILHGIGGHVGQRCLYVAEKLLAAHEHALHLLALVGKFAVLVHFEARQELDGGAQGRARRQAQRLGVKLHRVRLHREQAREGRDGGFAQSDVGGGEADAERVDAGALRRDLHLAVLRLVAHTGHAERIAARLFRHERETAVGFRRGAYAGRGVPPLPEFHNGCPDGRLGRDVGHMAA